MNILVFTTVYPNQAQPGLGVFVRERMKRVAARHQMEVIAPVPWFPLARVLKAGYRPRVPRLEEQDGIRVHHPRFFSVPGLFKCLDGLFVFLSVLITVLRLRKSFPFELIDAHFAYPDGLAAILLGKVLHVPVTVTLRGTIVPLSAYLLRRFQIRWVLKQADRVIAVSGSLKAKALEIGPQRDIRVIPNGVDTDRFYPVPPQEARQELGLDQQARILVSVGGLVRRKGFHRVLEVLPDLVESHADLQYVIIGGPSVEGDIGPELEDQANRLGLNGRVRFTGPLPPDQVRTWLNAADLFCLGTSNEGWANVLMESLACGTPVVATDVGGNAEIVSRQELGIIVPFGDSAKLRQALIDCLSSKWDHEAILAHSRSRSWEKVADEVVEVLASSLKDKG
ncbi:MAG: glycosyltransferase [Desulfohalobiaceae bacterium]|nr:glycosyltransferase [Desulfohalobiaceae bacterium]